MATTTNYEQLITLEDIAEVLPLTQGEGSFYRKDETGHVNHEKVSTGAETARVSFQMTMPKLSSPDFSNFISAAKHLTETNSLNAIKAYSKSDINKVKTNSITGAIANNIIKEKYSK